MGFQGLFSHSANTPPGRKQPRPVYDETHHCKKPSRDLVVEDTWWELQVAQTGSDRFACNGQRFFRCIQPYDLLRVENILQQRKRYSCATTKIHHPPRCDFLLSQEI